MDTFSSGRKGYLYVSLAVVYMPYGPVGICSYRAWSFQISYGISDENDRLNLLTDAKLACLTFGVLSCKSHCWWSIILLSNLFPSPSSTAGTVHQFYLSLSNTSLDNWTKTAILKMDITECDRKITPISIRGKFERWICISWQSDCLLLWVKLKTFEVRWFLEGVSIWWYWRAGWVPVMVLRLDLWWKNNAFRAFHKQSLYFFVVIFELINCIQFIQPSIKWDAKGSII